MLHLVSANQVFWYDPEREVLKRFLLPEDIDVRMFEDENHALWMKRADDTWHILTAQTLSHTLPDTLRPGQHFSFTPATKRFKGLPAKLPGRVWYFGKHGLVHWYQDSIINYALDVENGIAQVRLGMNYSALVGKTHPDKPALVEDKVGDRIFVLGNAHAFEIDPLKREVSLFRDLPPGRAGPQVPLCDVKSRIWMDIEKDLYRLDLRTGRLTEIRVKGWEDRPSRHYFECERIYQDRDQNIWLTTNGKGTLKYPADAGHFKYYGESNLAPSLSWLYVNRDGNLVFLDADFMLVTLNPHDETITELVNWNKLKSFAPELNVGVFFYRSCNDGSELTFGRDQEKKIFQFAKISSKGKLEELIVSPESKRVDIMARHFNRELHGQWEVVTAKDSVPPGEMHTFELIQMDSTANNGCQSYFFSGGNRKIDAIDLRAKVVETPDGSVWVGFYGSGLYRFYQPDQTWKHYYREEGGAPNISGNRVLSMLPDPEHPDSVLWVGTSEGLTRFNFVEERSNFYTTADGLPNNVIYGILADGYHNLWLSTNQGLCNFNPATGEVRNFTAEDGLQHNEFNKMAYVQTRDSLMAFGGVGGLTWFDPKDFYGDQGVSPVVINGLRLYNETVNYSRDDKLNTKDFRLESPLEALESITLPHDAEMLTFEFACLDLTSPEKNEFRYRLENFNDNWIEARTQHEATFTNVPPGNYTFRVQGRNHRGIWNREGASIGLVILRPWWGTWWFRIGVAGLLAFGLYSLVRFRQRQREKLHVMRHRISRDLHDEIGSTLSSISLFGAVARKEIQSENGMLTKMLTRINDSTVQVMESINDIVWAVKPDNDKMEHVVNRMRAYTSDLIEATEWEIEFKYDSGLLEKGLNMVQRRNIYLIFKEAVNNAIKYSGGRLLQIQLKAVGRMLHLQITDDGAGFDLAAINPEDSLGGNGLNNMRSRAEELKGDLEIITSPGSGTSVQLNFDMSVEAEIG